MVRGGGGVSFSYERIPNKVMWSKGREDNGVGENHESKGSVDWKAQGAQEQCAPVFLLHA